MSTEPKDTNPGVEAKAAIESRHTIVVGHLLAQTSPNCPTCGAGPSEHEVRNYDRDMRDGDVYCKCGTFVRYYDAG